jgi:methionyl-tRNA formyltransferase
MNIIYYGRGNAGLIGLLTLLSTAHRVKLVIPECENVKAVAMLNCIPTVTPAFLNTSALMTLIDNYKIDLLLCCHGSIIINTETLNKIQCVNVHPCLYKYKGTDPIRKVIRDQETRVSVGIHRMTEVVDVGEVLVEEFMEIEVFDYRELVYNQIYPLYAKAIYATMRQLEGAQEENDVKA